MQIRVSSTLRSGRDLLLIVSLCSFCFNIRFFFSRISYRWRLFEDLSVLFDAVGEGNSTVYAL